MDEIDFDAIEEAAIRAASNFGASEFNKVVDEGDKVLLYNGDRLVMIINMPLKVLMAEPNELREKLLKLFK